MLEIKNLIAGTEDKTILDNFNLKILDSEIHILMGPNGAGKSTVCKTILHHPNYSIKSGSIFFNSQEITNLSTSDIAKMGIYYINQTPIEIEGITTAELLRAAMSEAKIKMDIFEFNKKCNELCTKLKIPKSFLHRNVNEGMSGGERKKSELLGMFLLKPKFILLDEIDSGLDVDALKIVGEALLEYQKEEKCGMLVITHQQKLIDYLNPDYVHVMGDGKILLSGTKELAKNIENNGFTMANNVGVEDENE